MVSAGVLAKGWRGGPQANLSRLLKGCDIEDRTKAQACAVGTLALVRIPQSLPRISPPGRSTRSWLRCAPIGKIIAKTIARSADSPSGTADHSLDTSSIGNERAGRRARDFLAYRHWPRQTGRRRV